MRIPIILNPILCVADVSYQPTLGSKTASTVDYAKFDADSISTASRRQDKRLLSDVTTRLVSVYVIGT